MTQTKNAAPERPAREGNNAQVKRSSSVTPAHIARPLKPRKGLLIFLSIVNAVWWTTLLVIYFTTVRHFGH